MPATHILGKDAKIYRGDSGAVLSAMTEMSNVKDVTVNMEDGLVDITTRASGRFKSQAPTFGELSIEWEMLWKPADLGFQAVKNAYINKTALELAALDQDKGVAGAQGPKGSFYITSFSRSEPLEEAITVSVKATLSEFDQWVE